jgi:hypothetical protein
MIRVLFGAGTAAAANGITADVDLLLDAGAAGSAGDDFTINLTLDEGAATGEGFSAGLDESVALSITGGQVAAGVEIAGADETVTVTFSSGQAPGGGLNADVGVSLVAGEAEGNSFDADAAAYIAAVEAADAQTLELAVKTAYNDFVVGCKSDGIWNAIKASCIMAGARTRAGALVPLKGTAPTENGTVGGWNYNRKTGLAGNGTDNYLNSNRAGNADPRNSKHISLNATGSTGVAVMGNRANVTGATYLDNDGTGFRCRVHTSSGSDDKVVSPIPYGFLGGSRSASATISFRYNGANSSGSQTSEAPQSDSILIFARRNTTTGNAEFFKDARLSFYSIGESLNLALLDTRVSTLISAIDAAIP